MNETRPTNHTPAIALVVAAGLLLVVAGMSYKDYVRKSLEKEYAEKANIGRYTQPQQGYQQQQQGNPYYNQQQPQQQQPYAQNQRMNQFPAVPQQQAAAPTQQIDPTRLPRETNLQTPRDPEVVRLEENLAKVKAQAAETEKRYNDLTRKVEDQPAQPRSQAGNSTPPLSAAMQNSLISPPGGNPEITESITRMKKQVLSSPSIGRVLSYDVEWGIVTFGAGADQGVKKNQRFAVRRGSDLLGWVKVDEVHADMSIAHLITKNADSDMSLKPQAGDDLIQFEL